MSRLLLLRHGRAAWAEPGGRDFDRPLETSGREESRTVAGLMLAAGVLPDRVLCSTARRARQTWEDVASQMGGDLPDVTFMDQLYSTDAAGYLDLVRECGDAEAVLVVGHNPMVEDMAFAMAKNGEPEAQSSLAGGFPTAGLAAIRFDVPLSEIGPGTGYLEAFFSPTDA